MNPRQKSMIVGAILGAAVGALGGYLFMRRREQAGGGEAPRTLSLRSAPPGDMAKLFIAIMGVLRGVAELGERL